MGRFPGAVFQNRIPPSFASFVDAEVQALVDRGFVLKYANVQGPGCPPWPRLVMALSVEETNALDLRREAVKKATQGDSFLDGYGGAGG